MPVKINAGLEMRVWNRKLNKTKVRDILRQKHKVQLQMR